MHAARTLDFRRGRLFGGLCAMINPAVALAWGVLSLGIAIRKLRPASLRSRCPHRWACLPAPWTIRNYLVFGRLIPSKSNLYYEMYQAHGLQYAANHPYHKNGKERREYERLGEAEFQDLKRDQLLQAIKANPLTFVNRTAGRFLNATLWYVAFSRRFRRRSALDGLDEPTDPPLGVRCRRIPDRHCLLAAQHELQWTVIGVYFVYLVPYIGASYYERYGLPLLGVKVLLVIWATDRLLSWRRPRLTPAMQHNQPQIHLRTLRFQA